jgi:cbb3-type cytochrome oxidase subunit 1
MRPLFNAVLILIGSILFGFLLAEVLDWVGEQSINSFWILTIGIALFASPLFYVGVIKKVFPKAAPIAQTIAAVWLAAVTATISPYAMWMISTLVLGE